MDPDDATVLMERLLPVCNTVSITIKATLNEIFALLVTGLQVDAKQLSNIFFPFSALTGAFC